MLYVISSVETSPLNACDFEIEFALNEKRKVEVSVFVRCFEGGNAYRTFVGKLPYEDALLACDTNSNIREQLKSDETSDSIIFYRECLPLTWKNRAKYMLKWDEYRNSATVLIVKFSRDVLVSPGAIKRKPRFFGGFSLLQLESGEQMKVDGVSYILANSCLKLLADAPGVQEDKELVDCTGILHHGTILAPNVTLF